MEGLYFCNLILMEKRATLLKIKSLLEKEYLEHLQP